MSRRWAAFGTANGSGGGFARAVLVGVLVIYQRALSPWLGPHCRFYPSCSQYAKEAVLKHGALRGVFLAVRRIVRCHPWNPGGVDFVP